MNHLGDNFVDKHRYRPKRDIQANKTPHNGGAVGIVNTTVSFGIKRALFFLLLRLNLKARNQIARLPAESALPPN